MENKPKLSTKSKLIIVITFIAIVAIIAIATTIKSTEIPTNLAPQGVIQPPVIPQVDQGEVKFTNNVSADNYKLPPALPVLNVTPAKAIDEAIAKTISNNLGFTQKAIDVNDVIDGRTFIWSEGSQGLVVYADARRISYSKDLGNQRVINSNLNNIALEKIATDFLVNNGIYSKENLTLAGIAYVKTIPGQFEELSEGNENDFDFYQVNLSYKVTDIPILSVNPKNSPIYFWVLPDGTITKAEISLLGEIRKSTDEVNLITYDQFSNNIRKASLILLDNGNISTINIHPGDIQEYNVNSVEVAYLVDNINSKYFQPILLLKGEAKTQGGEFSAWLYLPALAANYP